MIHNFYKGKINYPKIFSPLQINKTIIPNRIFFPPWCFNWAEKDGTLSDKLFDFYLDLAKGGCGLIITGCAAVSPDSLLYERSMKIYESKHVKSFKKLCDEISFRGLVPGIQLMNFGRQSVTTWTGKSVYAPSAIPCPVKSKIDPNYQIREMDNSDIERVKKDFIKAAELSAEAGFKHIQLHAANGFLLSEFISPYTNKRTDEYGGSVENRLRIILEIIEGIKRSLGNSIILDIRITADEFMESEGGIVPSDHKDIVPLLEIAGVNMINLGFTVSKTTGKYFRQHPKDIGEAAYKHMAEELKGYSIRQTPIGYSGFVSSLDTAELLLSDNVADLIGLGRAQVADPGIVSKSLLGQNDKINKCKWDNGCLFSFSDKKANKVFCAVNKKYSRNI